jgi:hypothetical protein
LFMNPTLFAGSDTARQTCSGNSFLHT